MKTTQAMPMHEQVIEKLNRCKKLRQAVFEGDQEKTLLQESANKLKGI